MKREEMLAAVRTHIGAIKANIAFAERKGWIEAGSYSWADNIFEDTGVDVRDDAAVNALADEDLRRIIAAYT